MTALGSSRTCEASAPSGNVPNNSEHVVKADVDCRARPREPNKRLTLSEAQSRDYAMSGSKRQHYVPSLSEADGQSGTRLAFRPGGADTCGRSRRFVPFGADPGSTYRHSGRLRRSQALPAAARSGCFRYPPGPPAPPDRTNMGDRRVIRRALFANSPNSSVGLSSGPTAGRVSEGRAIQRNPSFNDLQWRHLTSLRPRPLSPSAPPPSHPETK